MTTTVPSPPRTGAPPPPPSAPGGPQFNVEPPRAGRRKSRFPEIALAVLLITLGAAGAVWWKGSDEARQPVLAMRNAVRRGEVVRREDLMVVELNADTRLATIPDKESGRAIGKIAAADLAAGAVVSPDQFTETAPIKDGEAIVGMTLEPGEVPTATMRPGDTVQVVQAAKAQSQQGAAGPASSQTRVLVRSAEVVDVVDRQGRAFVSLRMSQDDALAVSGASALQQVRLVQIPRGTR
jgi:SAF domain-containing protein